MKVVISVCTFAAVALVAAGAPTFADGMMDDPYVYLPHPTQYYRGRRSGYGAAYASPCSAGPAHAYISPAHASYGLGYGGGQAGFGYGGPHYRSDGDMGAETEILNFSDMDQGMTEHMPMARYGGYGPAAASAGHGSAGISAASLGGAGGYGQLSPAVAASGPAFAVFPGANSGGCNVPLLLSCSPSIVPGRLAKSHSGYGGGYGGASIAAATAGNAYRGADDLHQEIHEEHSAETTAHDQLETTNDATHTGTHQ